MHSTANATKTLDPSTCGNENHPPECLCDIPLAPATECATFPWRDSYLFHEVVSYLDLCAPFSDADILRILTMQTETHDAVEAASHVVVPITDKPQKLNVTMKEFVAERTIAGDTSPMIRAEVKRIWGVDISKSHMSHMRNRYTTHMSTL